MAILPSSLNVIGRPFGLQDAAPAHRDFVPLNVMSACEELPLHRRPSEVLLHEHDAEKKMRELCIRPPA